MTPRKISISPTGQPPKKWRTHAVFIGLLSFAGLVAIADENQSGKDDGGGSNQTRPATLDTDGDGLTDHDENYIYGTDFDNPDTDGDTVNDGEDGWALDENLSPPRVSENYVVIDLSSHLPFPTNGYEDLRIHVDDQGGTMLGYMTDASTPSASIKKFVTLYYNFKGVLAPSTLNSEILMNNEVGIPGDEVNGYKEYTFNMTQVLNRQGKISFQGDLNYVSLNTPPNEFTALVSTLDVRYDTTAEPNVATTSVVIPATHLDYVTSNVDISYGDIHYYLKLHHSKYSDDFAGVCKGADPYADGYFTYFQNNEIVSQFHELDFLELDANTSGATSGQMQWDFEEFGANGAALYNVSTNSYDINAFDLNAFVGSRIRLVDGTLKDLDDEHSYSIISCMETSIILRSKSGGEYSLDNGTTFHPSKAWLPEEQKEATISFAGESSEDLTILQNNRVLLNGRARSFADLIGDQSEQWSSIQLTDINSYGMMVGHANDNGTEKVIALLKVDLEWESQHEDNEIEEFTVPSNYSEYTSQDLSWLEGKRYFPGAESQSGTAYRNKINVKVSVPGFKNGKVKLRAFDVDDPTPISGVDDDSGILGDDNNELEFSLSGGFSGVVSVGTKESVSLAENSITLLLDDDGEGVAEFLLSPQPGNNYRVAAELLIDGQTSEIGNLQVDAEGNDYVTADNEPIPALQIGATTDMLTVWRKLHIEVDSMEVGPPASGDESNTVSGTITGYAANTPTAGRSTLTLSLRLPDEEDRFKAGNITLSGAGVFEVKSNSANLINDDTVEISGDPGSSVIGQSFTIVDDDDFYLSEVGSSNPLPQDGSHAYYIDAIRPKYASSFIEVENANALGLNLNTQIPFKLNEKVVGLGNSSHFDGAKDLNDSKFFWAHALVFGYQAQAEVNILGDGGDGDPNGEPPLLGGTPKTGISNTQSLGYSVVFMEAIRDQEIGSPLPQAILNDQGSMAGYNDRFIGTLLGTAAHEIAHSPGEQSAEADHAEQGLMREGGARINVDFSGASIDRFRKALGWSE